MRITGEQVVLCPDIMSTGFAAAERGRVRIGDSVGAAMPDALLAYQRGVLRWQTRLLAYHASLVEEYPPFAFDTGASEVLPSEPAIAAR